MLNHLHLIVGSPDVAGFVRDFKRHTSRELHKNIIATEPSIERLFLEHDARCAVWQPTNMPVRLETEKVFLQKVQYIHENPVRKQYVLRPEDWYWSSANPVCELTVDSLFG
jgi:REP element-mobilizing transposase RayT